MKHVFFVEGKADAAFVRDCLFYVYRKQNLKVEKDAAKEKIITAQGIEIKIVVAEGFAAKSLKTRIKAESTKGKKIVVIIDADNSIKDSKFGGFEKRTEYLNWFKNEYGVNFQAFLFPDNKNDGDLETLLMKIADKDKYAEFEICYRKYINCLKQIAAEELSKELFEPKNIIFSYFRTHYGMKKAKEENRIYTTELWNFEHENIQSFFRFLKQLSSQK